MKQGTWIVIALVVIIVIIGAIIYTNTRPPRMPGEVPPVVADGEGGETPDAGETPMPATGEPIKIGAILPLTGTAAEIARQHKTGIDMAVEAINASNPTRTLEIVYEDDQNYPSMTVTAFNYLLTKDVTAIITVMSGPSMAVRPLAEDASLVLLANCGHPDISKGSTYVFRNFPNTLQEVTAMLEFANSKLSISSVAILYIDDAYGEGAYATAEELSRSLAVMITKAERFARDASDIKPAISSLLLDSPDAIYLYGYGKATATALNQLRELGFSGYVFGSYNFSQPPATTIAGDSLHDTFYTLPQVDLEGDRSVVREFQRSYQAKYNEPAPWNAIIEYDAIHWLYTSAIRCSTSFAGYPESLSSTSEFSGVAGTYTKYQGTNDWVTPMVIVQNQNGSIVDVST